MKEVLQNNEINLDLDWSTNGSTFSMRSLPFVYRSEDLFSSKSDVKYRHRGREIVENSGPAATNFGGPEGRYEIYKGFFMKDYIAPPLEIGVLHDIYISGASMIISNRSGETLTESVPNWHSNPLVYETRKDFENIHDFQYYLDDDVIIVGNYSYQNYWHWIAQCLQALYQVSSLGLLSKYKIALPYGLKDWQKESLERLGVDPSLCIELPFGRVRIRSAIWASLLEQERYNPFSYFSVGFFEKIRAKNSSLETERTKSIYISRMDSNNRRLLNESALIERLREIGFFIMEPWKLSFDDQINLASNADVIVSPHGAGMTNCCFARASTRVIEIIPLSWNVPAFLRHSNLLGQRHFLFSAEDVIGIDSRHNSTWTLDLESFSRFLESAMDCD